MTGFSFHKSWLHYVLNSLIACLLLVMLLPSPAAGAESDNTTPVEPPVSDNQTELLPPEADNLTAVPPAFTENMTVVSSPRINNRVLAEPDKAVELRSTNGRVLLEIPEGAVPEPVAIEMSVVGSVASTGMKILNLFELNAYPVDTGSMKQNGDYERFTSGNISDEEFNQYANKERKVTTFNKSLQLTVTHDERDMKGLDPDSLRLYYLDEETRQWQVVEFSIYSSIDSSLTAPIEHFSYYGEQANPLEVGPGKIMAAQVNLHSGAAMYSYPLELPPGPGGFTPSLTLTYNSGSVDEMKNKQDVGSWVGIGWSLGFGKISMSLATDEYSLNLNGSSYKLVSSDGVNFTTNPDQYLSINKTGNTWTVFNIDGTTYTFGGTVDSRQYAAPSDTYYCWNLSLIEDTNGNQAAITYSPDSMYVYPSYTWVRATYPILLEYGNVEVSFNFGYDTYDGTDGYLRYDNPKSTYYNPAPKVMETRRLDSIDIEINDSYVRGYEFDYNTTASTYSPNYSGIYYAGKMTLSSITQIGADESSELPSISFSYEDRNVYYDYSLGQTYTGNPGNPASLTWPFLTSVDSGYGGEIEFTYTQTPTTASEDIWTRQLVTTKEIDDGIGDNQTYSYTYSGNMSYWGYGFNQEYRGFNEVRETDASGNYVKHWFFTTGYIESKDSERLSGREYKTQWYDSSNNLLKEQLYDWEWSTSSDAFDSIYHWSCPDTGDTRIVGCGLAAASDGSIYATNTYNHSVQKFDRYGNFIDYWGSQGSGDGQFYYPWDLAIDSQGYVYVVDYVNCRVEKFEADGDFVTKWGSCGSGEAQFYYPRGIAVDSSNNIYVIDPNYPNYVQKYDSSGNFILSWGGYGTGDGQLNCPYGIAIDSQDYVYVSDTSNYRIQVFTSTGTFVRKWGSYGSGDGQFYSHKDIEISDEGYVCVADQSNNRIQVFESDGDFLYKVQCTLPFGLTHYDDTLYVSAEQQGYAIRELRKNWTVQLDQVEEITYGTGGNKTTRTRYEYDEYGNVITEFVDGDTSTNDDDATIWRLYYPNTTDNILNRVARERVYATAMATDSGGANLKAETMYYYDGNNASLSTPPTVGNLTRVESKKDAGTSVSSYYTYDGYGNRLTEVDPNSNTTAWTYDATHHTYPATKTYPIAGLSESYTYDPGTNNILTMTDVNGQTTSYQYDTFKRLTKVIKPGDSSESPTVQYLYNSWGTINSQNIEIRSKTTGGDYLWQKDYFDGLGRVVQTHNEGESGHTIVSGTTVYNTRGLTDKQYVSQDVASVLSTYQTPSGQYTGYTYDALGRVTTQTNADGTTIGRDYSNAWQELVTNQRGYKTRYYYDAFGNLVTVEELNAGHTVYATTEYDYDTLGNLLEVEDDDGNTTTMSYDWLSRKTGMSDPDMGSWSYGYDSNGNLTTQTDAKSQTITFGYDYLNRLTSKTYPGGLGMTNVSYTYDSTSGGNYGKGLRTGMTDALGTVAYTYDTRGRLITEDRVASSVHYITQYTYDSADRIATITYPTGETVTQTYNGRGLPYTVAGSVAGNLVTSAFYNGLGSITEINFNNGLKTTYGYYGTGGTYDTTGNYFGKLYEIRTLPQGGGTALVDVVHTWDASGNLATRQDVLASETETFGYDFLDRLTSVSGPYSYSYAYDEIGNLVTRNGVSYTYNSTQPHAVDAVGGTNYYYDNNGNMTTRAGQTITWDAENRPVSITEGGTTTTFVYDGDGNRVQKVEGGETILYINKFYEKNLTTTVVTTSYYLGGTLVAQREDTTLRYAHQDHLSGTSLMTDTNGNSLGTMKYYPFGSTRSGSVPTDELFTGQKLDGTGLYYYGARYYDPTIGRFISPDTIIPYPANPQSYNRYSYCRNNPLKYVDPTGNLDGYGGYDYRDPNEYMLVIGLGSYGKSSAKSSEISTNETSLPLREDENNIIEVITVSAAASTSGNSVASITGKYLLPIYSLFIFTAIALDNQDAIINNIQEINEKITGWLFSSKSSDSKIIDDFNNHPENWEKTGESSEPATGKKYKGGTSVEETYRNKQTGQEIEVHKIYDNNGKIKHSHPRVK